MTHLNDTMSTSLLTTHKKNAHLTKEERVMIATLKLTAEICKHSTDYQQ